MILLSGSWNKNKNKKIENYKKILKITYIINAIKNLSIIYIVWQIYDTFLNILYF